MEWVRYRKTAITEMRPWQPGDWHPATVVQQAEGSPKIGDMIARDPNNPSDEWLITAKFFKDNYGQA